MSIILFIVILFVLVLVHEFGHFVVAKKFGIRVDEFGFGFPPKLFSKKFGETEYSFNAIPFGGFVKIFGENPDEESISGPDKARSLISKPKRVQAAVLCAGVFFNFLLAWLLFSVGLMSGMPTSVSSSSGYLLKDQNLVITGVVKGSPADLSLFKAGDKIISIDAAGSKLENISPSTVQDFIGTRQGELIKFSIERDGETRDLTVTPKIAESSNHAMIGVSLDTIGVLELPPHQALWHGLKFALSNTRDTAVSFFELIKNTIFGKADFSAVTGPVGIVGVVGDAYHFGFAYLLSFAALISINLAVINLIPFPALDGGRLLFILIEEIKGSPIKPNVANMINAIGFIFLLLLMAVVTFHDIVKLF